MRKETSKENSICTYSQMCSLSLSLVFPLFLSFSAVFSLTRTPTRHIFSRTREESDALSPFSFRLSIFSRFDCPSLLSPRCFCSVFSSHVALLLPSPVPPEHTGTDVRGWRAGKHSHKSAHYFTIWNESQPQPQPQKDLTFENIYQILAEGEAGTQFYIIQEGNCHCLKRTLKF